MRAGLLGQMVTPNSGNRLEPGVDWALDNGCFNAKWRHADWIATLERYVNAPRCLFAVVPDEVGNAERTDEMWVEHVDTVRSFGYRPAYVTQNGCTGIPDDAEAVFAGGDDAWKLGDDNAALVAEAKRRGLWAHMGRVNSLRRLRFAAFHGYDSVDGTFLAFGPDVNLPRLLRYLDAAAHPMLFGAQA